MWPCYSNETHTQSSADIADHRGTTESPGRQSPLPSWATDPETVESGDNSNSRLQYNLTWTLLRPVCRSKWGRFFRSLQFAYCSIAKQRVPNRANRGRSEAGFACTDAPVEAWRPRTFARAYQTASVSRLFGAVGGAVEFTFASTSSAPSTHGVFCISGPSVGSACLWGRTRTV